MADSTDEAAPPSYDANPTSAENSTAAPPPTYFADSVKQMNPDGKRRWGDPRPIQQRTDFDVINVPIKFSDYGLDPPGKASQAGGLGKLKSVFQSKDEFTAIFMTRGEYKSHWAKDEKGGFAENVTEPPGGRQEWLKSQLELNERYKKEEKEFKRDLHKRQPGENTLKWMVTEAQNLPDMIISKRPPK